MWHVVVHTGLLSLSAVTTLLLAAYAWRKSDEPGAVPFGGLMIAVSIWSVGYAIGLNSPDPGWRFLWERVTWFGIALSPLFWFYFAVEYTGYKERIGDPVLALLAVPPLVTLVVVWTNHVHGLLWRESTVLLQDGLAIAAQRYGPWYWLNLGYSYVLIGGGTLLLLWLIVRSDFLYAEQTVSLLVGLVVAIGFNLASVFGVVPVTGIDLTPYVFGITGLAFGNAIHRYRLFDIALGPRQIGRDAVVRDLEEGVLIVDEDGDVAYVNPRAASLFDLDRSDALGTPVDEVVDLAEVELDTEDAFGEIEIDDRAYEIRTSPIRDVHDEISGYTITITDVTETKRLARRRAEERDELAFRNEVNGLFREIHAALLREETREDIERVVCERLEAADLFDEARIERRSAFVTHAAEAVDPGASTELPPDTDGASVSQPAAVTTTASGGDEATSDDGGSNDGQVSDDTGISAAWHASADETSTRPPSLPGEGGSAVTQGGSEATAAQVPILYRYTAFGVLEVRSRRPEAYRREALAMLEDLGATVGYAISAAENEAVLNNDSVLQLELESYSDASPLAVVSGALDCTLELAGMVRTSDDDRLGYLRIEDADAERVLEELEGQAGTHPIRSVESQAGPTVEVELTVASLPGLIDERGLRIATARASEGACRVTVEGPPSLAIREFLDAVEDAFPDTSMVAKRQLNATRRALEAAETGAPLENLTERQREALTAAYLAGYFDWPREASAEDVAESLGIAGSTLLGHLRKGERAVLETLLDEEL